MILNKMRERRLAPGIVVAIGLFVLGLCVGGSAERPVQGESASAAPQIQTPNQRLHELMTKRYEILKNVVASLEISVRFGRTTPSEWCNANVALFKAKADLAADTAERIEIYEEMADFVRTCEQNTRQRVEAGQTPEADLPLARLATIEAQMVVERLRISHTQ